MAGDLPINESVILNSEAQAGAGEALLEDVRAAGGRVLHEFGQVVIAQLPQGARLRAPAVSGGLFAAAADVPAPLAQADLDETAWAGLQALQLRESPDFAQAKAYRPHQGVAWDEAGVSPPDAPSDLIGEAPDRRAPAPAGALPTSARMTGRIAVGVIFPQGPTADLQFTDAERAKVVAEVQNGLSWLASMEPSGNVSWSYEVRAVPITATRGPDSLSFDQKEERWRNPTMAALGFSADWAGVGAYVRDLRSRLRTDWAYCAFFTKYPIGWFAYASIGGPRLVMDYAVDGWGTDNMDRVFAHETGHVFGAPDEYAASNCNCGGAWGSYQKPNLNCQTCAPGGGIACLMKANDWSICPVTPAHLGWGPVPVVARHSGRVADVEGGSMGNGARIHQWDWHGGENQQFRPDPVGGGWYRIVALSSGKVLDVHGASTGNGAAVIQWDWHGGANQQFRPEPLGDGSYRIVARHSGRVLDVHGASTGNGAGIIQWDWHGGANQRWRWVWGPVRAKHSGRVFDVFGASPALGARVVQWDYHGGGNQQYRFDPVGGGWYRILVLHSGRVLDVHGASTGNGAAVIQWDWHGGANQQFRPEPLGDGFYRIIARHSGRVLDVHGASTGNGAAVIQWDWHGGANQRWRL